MATSSKIYGRKRRKPREPERTDGSSMVEIPNLPLGAASRTPYRPLACVASPEGRKPKKTPNCLKCFVGSGRLI